LISLTVSYLKASTTGPVGEGNIADFDEEAGGG